MVLFYKSNTNIRIVCKVLPSTSTPTATLIIENATAEICVYDAMGRMIGRDEINRVRTEIRNNTAGLYIVKVGNVAKRVMVN